MLLVTVPFAGTLKLVTVKLANGVSASLSLALISKVVLPFSATVPLSAVAIGLSFTGVTVMVTVPVSEPPASSLMV